MWLLPFTAGIRIGENMHAMHEFDHAELALCITGQSGVARIAPTFVRTCCPTANPGWVVAGRSLEAPVAMIAATSRASNLGKPGDSRSERPEAQAVAVENGLPLHVKDSRAAAGVAPLSSVTWGYSP